MKRKLIYNYCLIMAAWCMILNDYALLAVIFNLTACVLLLTTHRKINVIRTLIFGFISYVLIMFILSSSNILYFFPKLSLYLVFVSINCALTREFIYKLKVKALIPILMYMIVGVAVLSLIIIVLPNDQYSLFGKGSLYILSGLIFLPYIIPVGNCVLIKEYRLFYLRNKTNKIQVQN